VYLPKIRVLINYPVYLPQIRVLINYPVVSTQDHSIDKLIIIIIMLIIIKICKKRTIPPCRVLMAHGTDKNTTQIDTITKYMKRERNEIA
jgi:hypothetical protein